DQHRGFGRLAQESAQTLAATADGLERQVFAARKQTGMLASKVEQLQNQIQFDSAVGALFEGPAREVIARGALFDSLLESLQQLATSCKIDRPAVVRID